MDEEKLDTGRVRHMRAGRRVSIAVLCGLVAAAAAVPLAPWQAVVLLGWSTAAAVFVTWVLVAVSRKSAADTAALATREDSSRTAADLMLLGSSAASLGAVLLSLLKASSQTGAAKAILTGSGILSVVLSWAVVHIVFMLRYARLYYAEPKGGVDFNEETDPRYVDFAYLAFTIGMTYQVSDTNLTNRVIRASALRHALLSYTFGTAIIALTINVIAGLAR